MTNQKSTILKRKKKKDKSIEKFKKNGKFTSKHLRTKEELRQKSSIKRLQESSIKRLQESS